MFVKAMTIMYQQEDGLCKTIDIYFEDLMDLVQAKAKAFAAYGSGHVLLAHLITQPRPIFSRCPPCMSHMLDACVPHVVRMTTWVSHVSTELSSKSMYCRKLIHNFVIATDAV